MISCHYWIFYFFYFYILKDANCLVEKYILILTEFQYYPFAGMLKLDKTEPWISWISNSVPSDTKAIFNLCNSHTCLFWTGFIVFTNFYPIYYKTLFFRINFFFIKYNFTFKKFSSNLIFVIFADTHSQKTLIINNSTDKRHTPMIVC